MHNLFFDESEQKWQRSGVSPSSGGTAGHWSDMATVHISHGKSGELRGTETLHSKIIPDLLDTLWGERAEFFWGPAHHLAGFG